MSDWWVVGISYAVAMIILGGVVWHLHRLPSPSRQAAQVGQMWIDAAVQGMEQGAEQRSKLGVIGTLGGGPTASFNGCPVCGGSFADVGLSHRFEIKDDVRRCWTP